MKDRVQKYAVTFEIFLIEFLIYSSHVALCLSVFSDSVSLQTNKMILRDIKTILTLHFPVFLTSLLFCFVHKK